jgi:hypothetical protein
MSNAKDWQRAIVDTSQPEEAFDVALHAASNSGRAGVFSNIPDDERSLNKRSFKRGS